MYHRDALTGPLLRLILAFLAGTAAEVRSEPVISEFMASNGTTLQDSDGLYADWIELYNTSTAPVDLGGWYLTDSAGNKSKWQFPAVTLPARSYLVVFASNKNRRVASGQLHTNFALSNEGEYLALIKPDGVTVATEFAPRFPPQSRDVSYGQALRTDGRMGTVGYFEAPSPGKPNASLAGGALSGTVSFSHEAGPFSAPFSLTLSGAAPGQKIRYVLATPALATGALPAPTANSAQFTGPILIDRSVAVRAAIFADDDSAMSKTATTYYAKFDPNAANFSSSLPVLVVDTMGTGPLEKDGIDHPAWIYVYGADATPDFPSAPDLITPAEITVRGSSSATFPKKGYNLKLTDNLGENQVRPLLDLPEHAKWPWSPPGSSIPVTSTTR